jgi:hypothetical protein
MKVNIYIGFWTLKIKFTQYGLYEQAAFKNARLGQGRGRPGLGGWGSGFFGAALVRRPNACNAHRGYLESLGGSPYI